jgi:hypothetical protein
MYQFVDTTSGIVISEAGSNNLLNLKKLVRNTLLELGVPLEKEVKNFKSKTEEAA